jgi:hypothetical protein
MEKSQFPENKHTIRARLSEFDIPPIRDGLVLGKSSAIGCVAMRNALELLHAAPFEHIEMQDEVISDILVRKGILRRMPKEKLIQFVLMRIKPMMDETEIMHLELKAEVNITEEGI